ncbi:hypothetical protein MTBLM5_110083 [Magnetospirillum sp. LM-5]|nr:hypothetical protein MTBLM5_110083 [Magnetospirillum sp. LM-5]
MSATLSRKTPSWPATWRRRLLSARCLALDRPCRYKGAHRGWVAERFKAPVLKTGVGATLPWVRIPPHPPKKPQGEPWGFFGGCGSAKTPPGSVRAR